MRINFVFNNGRERELIPTESGLRIDDIEKRMAKQINSGWNNTIAPGWQCVTCIDANEHQVVVNLANVCWFEVVEE